MKLKLTSILMAAGILVGCNETVEENVDSAAEVREIASEDTAVMYQEENIMGGRLEADEEEFKEVDFGAPTIAEPDMERAGVEVRGAGNYRIYSVGEDVMFALDKAQIRPQGEEKLKQIANKLKQANKDASIRIYGFTDSLAGPEYNMELAKERARAVETWFQKNSGLDTARMKIYPMGENYFEATNATPAGRQQNRRVEIVVVEK